MCKHGDTVDVEVTIVASHSHTGQDRREVKPIDRCIADAVRRLDSLGIRMLGSCCGHGERRGTVVLERESFFGQEVDADRLRSLCENAPDAVIRCFYKPVSVATLQGRLALHHEMEAHERILDERGATADERAAYYDALIEAEEER